MKLNEKNSESPLEHRYKAIIFGLDDSGKSTLLHKMKTNDFKDQNPTNFKEIELIHFKNHTFDFYDVRRHFLFVG